MKTLLISILLGLFCSGPATAEFVGTLAFSPSGCEKRQDCRLVYDFGYIDPDKVGWQAKAGDKTDGASIPWWAQPYIGQPFEKKFIKAAVIHDHYCDRHVRPMLQTHRAFYHALIESGVSEIKASIMYYAVRVGARSWVDLIEGAKCRIGDVCINMIGNTQLPAGATIVEGLDGQKLAVREPRFNDPDVQTDISEAASIIEASQDITLDQIDALVLARHQGDVFATRQSAILYQDESSSFPKE